MKMFVHVGGDLPESALPDLLEALREDEVLLVDGDDPELNTEDQIRAFKFNNSIEFIFDICKGMDGEIHVGVELDGFCKQHGLTYKKLLPSTTSDDDEHLNECYYYYRPGDDEVCIPTDGEGNIVISQQDTIELLDACWALYQRPLEDMSLLINDKDEVTKTTALSRLSGKTFDVTFKELLLTRVGHAPISCPPFRIIPGK